MVCSLQFVRALSILLCITILAMRVGGAHLHLCFDGGDPPASVHLTADVDDQVARNNAGKPHHDLDVSLSGEALAKKLESAVALPALLATILVLFIALVVGGAPVIARDRDRPICSIPLFRLRPPLRAPPL